MIDHYTKMNIHNKKTILEWYKTYFICRIKIKKKFKYLTITAVTLIDITNAVDKIATSSANS